MAGVRARGQPLVVLVVLLSGWVGARAVAWNVPPDMAGASVVALPAPAAPLAPAALSPRPAVASLADDARVGLAPLAAPWAHRGQPAPHQPRSLSPVPAGAGLSPPSVMSPAMPPALSTVALPRPSAEPSQRMMTAGGHQLLWLAAVAMLPMPADLAGRFAPAPNRPARQPAAALPRWSADAWLFLRRGGAPVTFPRLSGGGTYGASQAGAVLRYRLAPDSAHRPAAYLRAAGALNGTREQEVAVGLAVRPLAGVPVAAMAEVRASRNGQGTTARPALALVSELPPQRLPFGFTGEAYVQAGYVGGRGATAFVDGLVRAELPVFSLAGTRIHAGAGAWGAKQRGAERLDVGPVASVRLGLGDTASARLEADWRFRVAGSAHPGSGPALTLSAGF